MTQPNSLRLPLAFLWCVSLIAQSTPSTAAVGVAGLQQPPAADMGPDGMPRCLRCGYPVTNDRLSSRGGSANWVLPVPSASRRTRPRPTVEALVMAAAANSLGAALARAGCARIAS